MGCGVYNTKGRFCGGFGLKNLKNGGAVNQDEHVFSWITFGKIKKNWVVDVFSETS